MNNPISKTTMNKKSVIGLLFVGALTFTATSCADMFNIDSSRVVYEHNHKLDSSADSVYSTIGILHAFQKIADRYIILGEVRGDMVDINKNAKASLRNLSEFNFDDDNEYLQVRDYYNVINNCNYLIAHMDTTIRHNNEAVMTDEYVAALSIRAWTYMQLALNYGKVPYYTNPITTVAASEADYPKYDIKELALVLIPQLMPYMEYKLPAWDGISAGGQDLTATNCDLLFPPIQLILGDLYLWLGDYQNAWMTYRDFITDNPKYTMRATTGGETTNFPGLMPLGNGQVKTNSRMTGRDTQNNGYPAYNDARSFLNGILGSRGEAITVVPMESSSENGMVSEVPGLFTSRENTHPLRGSNLWQEISSAQDYFFTNSSASEVNKEYSILGNKGDQRINLFVREQRNEEDEFETMEKFVQGSTNNGTSTVYYARMLTLYRRALVHLRAAEALNCLANQQHNGQMAAQAFGILRDGFDLLFPNGNTYKADLQPFTLGVHARGCGEVYLDTASYTVRPEAIAKYYNKDAESINFTDTIHYVEDRICDELALETTFEGNRFTDLIRFAERRGADYLAGKVACRKGTDNRDEALYQKLLNKSSWYLPLK